MPDPELVTDPALMIAEFDLYKTERGWMAVHKSDPNLVHESTDRDALSARCTVSRCARTLRRAWSRGDA